MITRELHNQYDRASTCTSRGWYTKTASHWLYACRGWDLSRGRLKFAELGGGQDVPFEQAFSNLAHAYIKDKAPKLLDYEVGFQLIEKNQENTKAVGVFGFKVGSQWLYAPVFFLNGDLKGHELLYIKSQDAFVPLKENWLNYLLGRKPSILGEGVNRNLNQLGVMPPNLYQLSRSPQKFASASPVMQSWAYDAVAALAHAGSEQIDTSLSLEGFLKDAGAPAVRMLLEGCKQFPKIALALDKFYGPDFLERMVKHARSDSCGSGMLRSSALDNSPPRKIAVPQKSTKKLKMDSIFGGSMQPKSAGSLKVITMDQVEHRGVDVIHDLSKDDKEKLIRERVVMKDTRDDKEVSIAYNVQTKLELQNPDKTSVYEVLVKPDEFKKCVVIMGPYGQRGRQTFCTVIQLDGEHRWVNTHPSNIWTKSTYDDEAYKKWWEALPDADSLPGERKLCVLIGLSGEGTCPFRTRESYGSDPTESKLYDVSFRDYADHARAGWLPDRSRYQGHFDYDADAVNGERIRLTGKPGARMRSSGGDLWVPAGYKKLMLVKPPKKKGDGDADDEPCCFYDSDPGPLQLGNFLDLQIFIHGHTSPLKILSDGENVTVDGTKYDKVAALVHLCKVVGLREKQARQCIERAELDWTTQRRISEFRIYKQAAPGAPIGDMVAGAPGAPAFPDPYVGADPLSGGNIPTMQESEHSLPVQDLSASRTDRSIYDPRSPDPKSMAVAQHAAQTGQKEVFDTSMLGALLKSVRSDNMVDRYLGDMMKGMDRTGRVLFNYYWHGEEFEDRYGKQDMPELEDGLRNSFESQGDVALKLKQKAVDADPNEGMNVDLSEVANA